MGSTWRNTNWQRRRRAEGLRWYISWDERCKIEWRLKLQHLESYRSNFKVNSAANWKPMKSESTDVTWQNRGFCATTSVSILDTMKASQI